MCWKLVSFDGQHFSEVDQIALRRTARRLLELIPEVPDNDPYEVRSRLIPILKLAIEDKIRKQYKDDLELIGSQFIYERREKLFYGVRGINFTNFYAKLSVTEMALPLDRVKVEIMDGQRCTWMEFEEEGDWPNKVKYE
jgi:hypothetical protein